MQQIRFTLFLLSAVGFYTFVFAGNKIHTHTQTHIQWYEYELNRIEHTSTVIIIILLCTLALKICCWNWVKWWFKFIRLYYNVDWIFHYIKYGFGHRRHRQCTKHVSETDCHLILRLTTVINLFDRLSLSDEMHINFLLFCRAPIPKRWLFLLRKREKAVLKTCFL